MAKNKETERDELYHGTSDEWKARRRLIENIGPGDPIQTSKNVSKAETSPDIGAPRTYRGDILPVISNGFFLGYLANRERLNQNLKSQESHD